jgi:hypothetical protein
MSETGTADLSSLLSRLNAFCADTAGDAMQAPRPRPDEAMAMYSIAVRLVESRLDVADADLASSREVLISTRRMLHAALESVEAEQAPIRFRVIDGGRTGVRRRPGRSH